MNGYMISFNVVRISEEGKLSQVFKVLMTTALPDEVIAKVAAEDVLRATLKSDKIEITHLGFRHCEQLPTFDIIAVGE